jgi:hypothetical protein
MLIDKEKLLSSFKFNHDITNIRYITTRIDSNGGKYTIQLDVFLNRKVYHITIETRDYINSMTHDNIMNTIKTYLPFIKQ